LARSSRNGTVVIGASHAGVTLAATLRQKKYAAPITLISEEARLPYHRPPLSKAVLSGHESAETIELRPEAFYAQNDITLMTDARAVEVDRDGCKIGLRDGREIGYDTLVLATGARPRRLRVPGADLEGVITLRALEDAEALRARLGAGKRLLIVGAGYVGLEVAATARLLGIDVTVVETAGRVLSRVASPPIADWVLARHEAEGVALCTSVTVKEIHGTSGLVESVTLSNGETLSADVVVVGIGVDPETDIAAAAGIATDDGVLVDSALRTSAPAIFALGDCARFPCPWTGRLQRLESIQNAQDQARTAAAVISGEEDVAYHAVPWFWSDQYKDKLQSAGMPSADDQLVIEDDPERGGFTVWHHRDGRVVASESVNDARGHMRSRKMISQQQ
jgi:3-phenylpropionate/trans-cinnamate dioxygenase ferredoxin reductase subunit